MRIAIFGGSFNPVHNGHLKLACFVFSELNLEKIVFVPAYLTPLKNEKDLLPALFRTRLLRRAVRKYPRFSVSDYEIRKKGISYTIDTLKFFKNKYGLGSVFYFLAGADTLKNIFSWKSVNEVLKLCRFVVMTRPGHRLARKIPGAILLPMNALPVSSTQVRRRLEKGQSVQGLVPAEIIKPLEKYYRRGPKSKRRKR